MIMYNDYVLDNYYISVWEMHQVLMVQGSPSQAKVRRQKWALDFTFYLKTAIFYNALNNAYTKHESRTPLSTRTISNM
jgi:hypothetical protein